IPVTPDQDVNVTGTAGGASASATLVLELPPAAVTPSRGTFYAGPPVTFTVSGMGDSWSTTNNYMFLNVTAVASGLYFDWANSCMVEYEPDTQMVWLLTDSSLSYTGGAIGSTTTLQNSQCVVNLPGTASITNYVLTVSLPITFKSAFTGAMYLNIEPYDEALQASQTYYEFPITIAPPASNVMTA